MDLNVASKNYTIDEKCNILLDALIFIQENIDASLGFSYNCKSGVCGSCAVRVNGLETLACTKKIKDGDSIEPLKNVAIIKDLIVDDTNISQKINQVDLNLYNKNSVTQANIDAIDVESNCILCNSCYSSCPVFEYNPAFIGPFALTKAYRYFSDQKDPNNVTKLDKIQTNGVWDCTLCGNCSAVCPQSIDIKSDIQKLQNSSVQNGYQNPYMQSFGGFDSGGDFGFNPNGF